MSIQARTVLDAGLNALANGDMSAAGDAVDLNGPIGGLGAVPLLIDAEFYGTFAAAATAGAVLDLYAIPSLDGTNYVDAPTAALVADYTALKLGSFVCGGLVGAEERLKLLPYSGVGPFAYLPAGKSWKFALLNSSGQALGATGNTVKVAVVVDNGSRLA